MCAASAVPIGTRMCCEEMRHLPAESAVPNGSRVCCEEIDNHLQRVQSVDDRNTCRVCGSHWDPRVLYVD
jgi:hypothetical protein